MHVCADVPRVCQPPPPPPHEPIATPECMYRYQNSAFEHHRLSPCVARLSNTEVQYYHYGTFKQLALYPACLWSANLYLHFYERISHDVLVNMSVHTTQ